MSNPIASAWVVTAILGVPELRDDVTAICHRESRCQALRVHERDAWVSRKEWLGQVKLGHLDADCQPYGEGGWATRGAWGLSAASHWNYLPRCYPPVVIDVPLVSAWIAVIKYKHHCLAKGTRPGWCRVPRVVKKNNRARFRS